MTPLAMDGGPPVRTAPVPMWPAFGGDEVEAAAAVLRSGQVNYWTGPHGRRFERDFARFCGVPHAVAVANGTVAIELALWALNIDAGEVVVPARTFIATASAVRMRGATPVFADVDRDSGNLSAKTVQEVLTPRTKAVIAVHMAGWPVDIDRLTTLARARGIAVIEDCAQAHGAAVNGRRVGSLGDVAAFSFCQDKILTTAGEGGMVLTKDRDVWGRAWSAKDHGKSWEAVYEREHAPGFRWLHEGLGTNWRLSEVQSAVGLSALQKLPAWLETRRRHAEVLRRRLGECAALRVPAPGEGIEHAYYKLYAYVRPDALKDGWTRDRIVDAVKAEGVPCFQGGCSEIYLEKAFPEAMRPKGRLPVARELGETSLMFLVHPTLEPGDIEDVATAVEKVMEVATQ